MFIRIKKIKGNMYAYLVENSWENNKARQKVKKYLGRIFTPEKTNQIAFEESFPTIPKEPKQIVRALMEWTLCQHGFVKDPLVKKKWIYNHGKIVGDPATLQITSGKNDVTLKINEGYMNEYTLKEIIQINIKALEQREAATVLAKACVSAGIQIPQEVFIELFQKVHQ
jgi:hypothetical protein